MSPSSEPTCFSRLLVSTSQHRIQDRIQVDAVGPMLHTKQ
jgi:hypothetical protein